MQTHTLLSGEVLGLSKLTEEERRYIRGLSGDAGDGADYFDLLRRVKGPKALPLRGGPIVPAIAASVVYRVAHDIADRVGIKQGYLLAPGVADSARVDRRADLLSLTEAADLIGITRPAAHQAVTEARLPGRRVGNAWIIAKQDAESYRLAKANRVAGDQAPDSRSTLPTEGRRSLRFGADSFRAGLYQHGVNKAVRDLSVAAKVRPSPAGVMGERDAAEDGARRRPRVHIQAHRKPRAPASRSTRAK